MMLRFAAVSLCLLLGACSDAAPSKPTTPAIDPFVVAAQMDAPSVALPCVSCHLADGRGRPDGTIPRLAGQPAAILAGKLARIAAGETFLPAMTAFARALTASERAEVAAWFARLPIPAEIGPGDPTIRDRGQRVYARLCAACHGEAGQGNVALDAPQLCRQHAGYIERRLVEIAGNTRGDASSAMAPIAAALSPRDRAAVASWLAATPCPEVAQ